jgi:hypothetical protein
MSDQSPTSPAGVNLNNQVPPSCEDQPSNDTNDSSDRHLMDAISGLEGRSKWLNIIGVFLIVIGIGLGVSFFCFITSTTQGLLNELNVATTPYVTLAFLVVRGSALTGVAISILLGLMRIANACFDQSARFAKRRYGAMFLQFLYAKYDRTSIHGGVSVENIMKFFESWNQTVESAFSNVKLAKKGTESMKVDATKDGVHFEFGESGK